MPGGGDAASLEERMRQNLAKIESAITLEVQAVDPVFKDQSWLTSARHPDIPLLRDQEYELILSWFKPLLRSSADTVTGQNCLITGKPGLGKTMVVERAVDFVWRHIGQAGRIRMPKPLVIGAKGTTARSVLHKILNHVADDETRLPKSENGLSLDEYMDRINQAMARQGWHVLLLVLDDAQRPDLLDGLIMNSGKKAKFDFHLQLLLISNNELFAEELSREGLSVFGKNKTLFRAYDQAALTEIYEYRGRKAFQDGVVEDGAYAMAGALTARHYESDVREGMKLLDLAADVAGKRSRQSGKPPVIRVADVQEALSERDIGVIEGRIRDIAASSPQSILVLTAHVCLHMRNRPECTRVELFQTVQELFPEVSLPQSHSRGNEILAQLGEQIGGLVKSRIASGGQKTGTPAIYWLVDYERTEKALRRLEGVSVPGIKDRFLPDLAMDGVMDGSLRLKLDNTGQKRL